MVLSGIWHGYGWNFLLWGALHGVALVALNLGDKMVGRNWLSRSKWTRWLAIIITFHFVCFTFVIFNTRTLGDAQMVFTALFANQQGWVINDWANIALLAGFGLMIALYPLLLRLFYIAVRGLEKLPIWLWFIPISLILILVIVFAPAGIPNFYLCQFLRRNHETLFFSVYFVGIEWRECDLVQPKFHQRLLATNLSSNQPIGTAIAIASMGNRRTTANRRL